MSIIDILENKELNNLEKLIKVGDIVNKVRKEYGNENKPVDVVFIQTPDGVTEFIYLSDSSKIVVLTNEMLKIKNEALTKRYNNSLVMPNKKVEELIATSEILCSLGGKDKITYL